MGANTGARDHRELEPVDLFEFLRTLEVAAHRKKLTRMQERVARLTAYDSAGTTGGGVVVNAARTAEELGISERRVWVHFAALVEAGWFVQTMKPTRGTGSSPGRRARYQCTRPLLDLGLLPDDYQLPVNDQLPYGENDDPPVDKPPRRPNRVQHSRSQPSDGNDDSRVTAPSAKPASDRPTPAESSDGFGDNRLTVLEESSDGRERENGTLSPSGGSPTDVTPDRVKQPTKPQTAREKPVDKPPVDNDPAYDFAGAFARVRSSMAAMPRHARPTPPPIDRPDRE